MNQKNAEMVGRASGQSYQRIQRGRNNPLSKENYERHGAHTAQIDARSVKSRDLFVKGWNSVWEDFK